MSTVLPNPIEVYNRVIRLLGQSCTAWELDSVFHTLEKDHGLILQPEEAEAFMALFVARLNPCFLWDFSVLQATIQALNFEEADTDNVVKCSPGECSRALKILELFGKQEGEDYSLEMYNHDCIVYVCGCFIDDGIVCLPEHLSVFDSTFDFMLPVSARLTDTEKGKIRVAAKKMETLKDSDMDSDNVLEVLVRKIQEVEVYTNAGLSVSK
jgi:hypothetical protein